MIHGPGNKGNLNLLYDLVNKSWPKVHPSFDNQRSFCSIENLLFVIKLIIEKNTVPSGIYNVSDDETLSTNDIIRLIAQIEIKKVGNLLLPGTFLKLLAYIGDYINLPLNNERLKKLTESYKVSNEKIIKAIEERLPIRAEEGLKKTLLAFSLIREK
jgi:nucleoside-diphosphate-sugar epimerase